MTFICYKHDYCGGSPEQYRHDYDRNGQDIDHVGHDFGCDFNHNIPFWGQGFNKEVILEHFFDIEKNAPYDETQD